MKYLALLLLLTGMLFAQELTHFKSVPFYANEKQVREIEYAGLTKKNMGQGYAVLTGFSQIADMDCDVYYWMLNDSLLKGTCDIEASRYTKTSYQRYCKIKDSLTAKHGVPEMLETIPQGTREIGLAVYLGKAELHCIWNKDNGYIKLSFFKALDGMKILLDYELNEFVPAMKNIKDKMELASVSNINQLNKDVQKYSEYYSSNPDGTYPSLHISPAMNFIGAVSVQKDPVWSFDVLLKIPCSDSFTLSMFYSYYKFEQEAEMPYTYYSGYYQAKEPLKLKYVFNKVGATFSFYFGN